MKTSFQEVAGVGVNLWLPRAHRHICGIVALAQGPDFDLRE